MELCRCAFRCIRVCVFQRADNNSRAEETRVPLYDFVRGERSGNCRDECQLFREGCKYVRARDEASVQASTRIILVYFDVCVCVFELDSTSQS